ncbi:MAG: hypothetical protein QOI95_2918 [Acidimicrobiaceae bacterium]|jgi:hypothetical protein
MAALSTQQGVCREDEFVRCPDATLSESVFCSKQQVLGVERKPDLARFVGLDAVERGRVRGRSEDRYRVVNGNEYWLVGYGDAPLETAERAFESLDPSKHDTYRAVDVGLPCVLSWRVRSRAFENRLRFIVIPGSSGAFVERFTDGVEPVEDRSEVLAELSIEIAEPRTAHHLKGHEPDNALNCVSRDCSKCKTVERGGARGVNVFGQEGLNVRRASPIASYVRVEVLCDSRVADARCRPPTASSDNLDLLAVGEPAQVEHRHLVVSLRLGHSPI